MDRKRDVLSYMNSFPGEKQYTKYQVSAIAYGISLEPLERAEEGLKLKTKTKEGRDILNKRVAEIANRRLPETQRVTAYDVWIYKKCDAQEREDRTGKCMWGFKERRRSLGFDESTGMEI